MHAKEFLEFLKSRRSIRKYSDEPVSDGAVEMLLEAARWAPSGTNNQPWRFVVVRDQKVKDDIAAFTKYAKIVSSAPVVLPVFIDKSTMYNDTKDHQAMGACLQNILLMAHSLGLGAVWLGEILKNAEGVRGAVGLDEPYELMAVVALGNPGPGSPKSSRNELDGMVLARL